MKKLSYFDNRTTWYVDGELCIDSVRFQKYEGMPEKKPTRWRTRDELSDFHTHAYAHPHEKRDVNIYLDF